MLDWLHKWWDAVAFGLTLLGALLAGLWRFVIYLIRQRHDVVTKQLSEIKQLLEDHKEEDALQFRRLSDRLDGVPAMIKEEISEVRAQFRTDLLQVTQAAVSPVQVQLTSITRELNQLHGAVRDEREARGRMHETNSDLLDEINKSLVALAKAVQG